MHSLLGGIPVLLIESIRGVSEKEVSIMCEEEVIGAVEPLALIVGGQGGETTILLPPVHTVN